MAKTKRTVKKTSRKKSAARSRKSDSGSVKKMELKYIPWNAVELEDLNPLLQRQFVVGQEMMLARVLLKKGCIVPEHSHHNEQITFSRRSAQVLD
jgi:quercetin dioxygenase-like cupin family protein